MPRVSVLIPATRRDYLAQTLASVLAQTEQDFEAIVADDSSAGDLDELVGRFADPRVRCVRARGRSQPTTIATLWAEAGSDYIHIVHDDDFLLPFCLATLLDRLDAEPTAVFAVGNSHIVSATGARIGQATPIAPGRSGLGQGASVLPRMLGRCENFLDGVQCVSIRRTAFPDSTCFTHYAGFPLRTLLDVGFYVNALREGPLVGVGEFHAAYRKHEQQASRPSFNPEHASLVYEWELIIRGEVAAGRLLPEYVPSAVGVLAGLYRSYLARYPELGRFLESLPVLEQRVATGDTAVLDADYADAWREADQAVQERVDQRRRAD